MNQHLTVINHPLVQHKLTYKRDENTPTNLFRQLLRETSQLLAYEITRNLEMTTRPIKTPMQALDSPVVADKKMALVSVGQLHLKLGALEQVQYSPNYL